LDHKRIGVMTTSQGHVTIRFAIGYLVYWWSFGIDPLSPAVFAILNSKIIHWGYDLDLSGSRPITS